MSETPPSTSAVPPAPTCPPSAASARISCASTTRSIAADSSRRPATSKAGYAHFLGTQLDVDDAVVLVAERAGAAVGYVFAGIEPFSWKELRDAAGFVHDIVVDPSERRSGVAGALMEAAIAWVRDQGVASVMLWTAAPNEGAQRLFEGLGFRRTMIEMTRDV